MASSLPAPRMKNRVNGEIRDFLSADTRQCDERKMADDAAIVARGHHDQRSGAGVVPMPVAKYRLERSPFSFFLPQALSPRQIIGLKQPTGEAARQRVTSSPKKSPPQAATPGPRFVRASGF